MNAQWINGIIMINGAPVGAAEAVERINAQQRRIVELEAERNVAVGQFKYAAKALEAKDNELASLRTAMKKTPK